jgi:ABC-2 type transport system permease protein
MTWAVFRAMLQSLVRDPGALVMSFVMPVAFFVIFATIFASAAGGDFELKVAVVDEVGSSESDRLLTALRRDPDIRGWLLLRDRAAAADAVRRGDADVGLVIRADGEPLGSAGGFGAPPLLILADSSSDVATTLLNGRLQQAYAAALPELVVGSVAETIGTQFTEFTSTQQAEIDAGLADLRDSATAGAQPGWSLGDLVETQPLSGRPSAENHVAYYAGAIAFMFLLFAAAQGALTLLDERDNGVLDRIVAGPGGVAVALRGRFAFLTVQGIVQTLVIFAVAWAIYKVDLSAAPATWLLIVVLSSGAAAAIALLMVTACRSRAQAETLTNVVILVMSAVGGSMVPRFFMPEWLQNLGWLTPNTWVLEAYSGVLARGSGLTGIALPLAMLVLATTAAYLMAQVLARRMTQD